MAPSPGPYNGALLVHAHGHAAGAAQQADSGPAAQGSIHGAHHVVYREYPSRGGEYLPYRLLQIPAFRRDLPQPGQAYRDAGQSLFLLARPPQNRV